MKIVNSYNLNHIDMETRIFKLVIVIFVMTLCINIQAQIKVHESGQISLQDYTENWNNGVQIFPSGTVHFNTTSTNAWSWVTVASPKHAKGKCWIVTYPDGETDPAEQKKDHRFFVTGEGYVHQRGSLRLADVSFQTGNEAIRNPGYILDAITGIYYTPVDETEDGSRKENVRVGVIAQEVEKVLPEAVSRDDQDLMYVDYEALTVVLIEAYKEQKSEIELLRKTLEEHGLLKP